MSEIENQLKKALIEVIKAKELQKLEFKKNLLKTLEKEVDQLIKNIEDNPKQLEKLHSEALISVFSQLKIPELTAHTVNAISITVVNLELDPRDPSPQRTIEKVVDLTSQTRTQFFHPSQFGQQIPNPSNFGFQPPFNFQNPPGPFPGFQGNQSPTQQSSGRPNNSEYKKFLIQKLESVYEKLGEQKISEELLTEFDKVITKFKKY